MHSPSWQTLSNGVPQYSMPGLFLFSPNLNNLNVKAHYTNTRFFADDELLYSCGASLVDTRHVCMKSTFIFLQIFCSLSATK